MVEYHGGLGFLLVCDNVDCDDLLCGYEKISGIRIQMNAALLYVTKAATLKRYSSEVIKRGNSP